VGGVDGILEGDGGGAGKKKSAGKRRRGKGAQLQAKKEQQKSPKYSSTKGNATIRLLKQKSAQKAVKDRKKTHSEHIQMFRKEGAHLMRAAELDNGRERQFLKDISQKRAAAQQHKGEHSDKASE
jgi:hypothetical protein